MKKMIMSQINLKVVKIVQSYFAALAHGSHEERMLERDIEASTRDANI